MTFPRECQVIKQTVSEQTCLSCFNSKPRKFRNEQRNSRMTCIDNNTKPLLNISPADDLSHLLSPTERLIRDAQALRTFIKGRCYNFDGAPELLARTEASIKAVEASQKLLAVG